MSNVRSSHSLLSKMKELEEDDGSDDSIDSEDDDETIARIQRAHFAQAAAMNSRRRAAPRPRPMSHKRKMEAVKNFHNFTKKLKKDTGITIHSLVGNNILELSDFSSEDSKSESDGLSEEEFVVNPSAVQELEEDNESYIDPFTGDIVQTKKKHVASPVLQQQIAVVSNTGGEVAEQIKPETSIEPESVTDETPKTLSISDIINEGDLDLTNKNVEIAEVDEAELCTEKTSEDLLDIKQEENSQDFDITEKLKEMGEISVKPVKKEEEESTQKEGETEDKKVDPDDEKKTTNTNALNVRRNIREVMDEKNLDASTLAAQRQESERLARVQEQQRIIREVQRQIAINRQNKIHQKTLSLLQGGSSLLKKSGAGQKLNLPNTVLVKLPSGEVKKTTVKQGQLEVTKLMKPTTSGAILQRHEKPYQKSEKKEVVEIVDSSSGEESSSSSSDSDDCIMLSDSEVPPSPEAADEDPNNSGLHVNDAYNIPDEQGRVLINIGHPENEEDIFVAPQIARIIKPHQIGGVRFLFDNIIESVERFSTSTGFGCILAHSMGLGKTLQIVCFCDIFLRHTQSKTVLCIMPINTLQNWVAEFNMWLPLDATNSPLAAHGEVRPRHFQIYVLNDSHKTLQMRAKVVKDWTTTGGVLMIGYELYRLLSMKKDKKPRKKKKADLKADAEKEKEDKKNDKFDGHNEDTQNSDSTNQTKGLEELKEDGDSKLDADGKDDSKKEEKKEDTVTDEDKKLLDEMYEALVKPGPDLVICDEGHRIKNSHSNISYALKQMRTKRRVVLTGYPLQNNLLEYWCMVDFVRPNYLGSKTEFCNMFERPIQNGQCIDSTPQDIRLMRYRAHVLHSLLVGFVQRRSHAVLQSTLPQKEEYVLLVRMTPLQRKLYDRFMNEVVRSTSVPNPLKAFAICCKIWNHPDVLYNFLKKRSEVNAAIEEDLDLEEIGGVTKAGRPKTSKAKPGRPAKSRGASKKPAATIQPNTTGVTPNRPDQNTFNTFNNPPNGPYNQPPSTYRPEQPGGSFPPYPNYQNQGPGYYPPNQNYNQNYDSNYYQQQPPYGNNYPNQYPQNNPEQGYNQNYWGNGNYYGNSGYYNNPQYPNNQPSQEYRGNPPAEFSNPQQFPPNYNPPPQQHNPAYGNNALQPYQNNQEGYGNQQRPPYQGYNQPGYPDYNPNAPPGPSSQEYSNQSYPPPYPGNSTYGPNGTPYNQYENQPPNYPNNMPGYQNNIPPNPHANNAVEQTIKSEPNTQAYHNSETKPEPNVGLPPNTDAGPYSNQGYNYPPNPAAPGFPPDSTENTNVTYPTQYPNFPSHLETKPPLGSAGSGSPVTSWPITEIKTEIDKLKIEEKLEMKSESDGEVKIEDLDTKKIVKDEIKKPPILETPVLNDVTPKKNKDTKIETSKSNCSGSEEDIPKKGKQRGKGKQSKKTDKSKPKGRTKAKGRKDRKKSKEKNNGESESEESEKEEKMNREEELAMVKKAEEVTYDWAAELLKDYIPGLIENSAKMELFFYILNESIKMGDRLLLFSQSLFTLNLIEDFLERNYIPGTNCRWERNTNYYRLDGSTHALEREKLINEFNANPHVYLFLVSTRAGSLGINLVGANRVIVFDASWNPCHDTQAVCRVYRYGQKKPCFVYRFVMDWCLEKKIYDRQINKQGMADRVVDECNPDAVLSMKEITNLCFDNDEKESEPKDLSEYKDKYLDILMQGIITQHWKSLSKEPFQHESLLVDRKEKKLSSAEKRLAQRGYELEKKAALAPKPTTAYRTVRTADGSLVQRPVASVRPMQHGARWIPADVWRRQGMSAQEMTLPLDVVIPTNSAEKTNIVLKAGQRVMVLKSPKGIYMQLESGKIIAIKTSFKGLGGQKSGDNKDSPIGKKVLSSRPSGSSIPGSLKNNSAITITSKTGPRPYQRVLTRPSMMNKISRPVIPGQKIADIRSRLNELRSYSSMRPRSPIPPGRLMRPNLPGSVSITKITKDAKKSDNENSDTNTGNRMDVDSEDDPQVLESDDDDDTRAHASSLSPSSRILDSGNYDSQGRPMSSTRQEQDRESKPQSSEPLVLTTDEKLPSEEALEKKPNREFSSEIKMAQQKVKRTKNEQQKLKSDLQKLKAQSLSMERLMPKMDPHHLKMEQKMPHMEQGMSQMEQMPQPDHDIHVNEPVERKINLLKNYRHQRQGSRPPTESSLLQLERTASVLNKEGMPDFRRNLDDITQSYSPTNEEKPASKSRKKKVPTKVDVTESQSSERQPPTVGMSHSVSSLLGSTTNNVQKSRKGEQNMAPVAPIENSVAGAQRLMSRASVGLPPEGAGSRMPFPQGLPVKPQGIQPPMSGMFHGELDKSSSPAMTHPQGALPPSQQFPPANPPPEGPYAQYPGYGMGYGAYPNPAYYGGYGAASYYPYGPPTASPYAAPAPATAPSPAHAPTPESYLPPNPQW